MSAQQEWLVLLPDFPGILEQRMKVRSDHLTGVQPAVQAGRVVLGGATLDEPARDGEALKINGSALIAVAATEEEVWDFLRRDVYYTAGVWDPRKIQIIPFKSAVRKEL